MLFMLIKLDTACDSFRYVQSKLIHIIANALFTYVCNWKIFFGRFCFLKDENKWWINLLLWSVSLKRHFYVMFSCKYSWSKVFGSPSIYLCLHSFSWFLKFVFALPVREYRCVALKKISFSLWFKALFGIGVYIFRHERD